MNCLQDVIRNLISFETNSIENGLIMIAFTSVAAVCAWDHWRLLGHWFVLDT